MITMRPSDVPTYVEAGAADIGVTGKDVLLEQARATAAGERGREVYELLDLGYGRCTMVLASKAGPDPAVEALRRLGVMRVATKYPRIAARYLEETGRQARDRRGQGLGRARAADRHGRGDRRPDGDRHDAAREQPRGPRGDRRLHGAADRQSCLAQAEGRADRRAAGAAARAAGGARAAADAARSRVARRRARAPRRPARRRRAASRARARRRAPSSSRCARSSSACATRATRAVLDYTRALRSPARQPTPRAAVAALDRVSPEELDAAIKRLPLEVVAGLQVAIANVAQVADAGVGARRRA